MGPDADLVDAIGVQYREPEYGTLVMAQGRTNETLRGVRRTALGAVWVRAFKGNKHQGRAGVTL